MDSLSDTDRVLQRKRRCTNAVIGFIFLLNGIEYAVILPTIWMYLQSLDAEPVFLGLVLSAFSFTELLVGPLFGYWSDRTGQTKSVIILSNFFEIAGNLMYFVGISKWFLLCSRLVAGVGSGAGASIFGYLTRLSSNKERLPVFALAMACRQVGLLIGPAFNVFLRYCDFQIGPFHVDKYSAPGIFMCALWILMQPLVLFMFHDIKLTPPNAHDEEQDPLLYQRDIGNEGCNNVYGTLHHNHVTDHAALNSSTDDKALSSSSSTGDIYSTFPNITKDSEPEDIRKESLKDRLSGLLREEVVVLLTAQFVTLFNQTALETLVTPLAQTYLGFQDLQNSLLYFLCGIEMLIGFLVVRALGRCTSDRLLLIFGLFVCNISCIWCLVFMAKPRGSYGFLLAEFVVGVFLQVLGLPFVAACQVSLFSKVTAKNTQGFNHGLRRSVGGLATILGPLWAAGLIDELYLMLGVMMGLLVLLTVMVSFSFRYLVDPDSSDIQPQ
ncbi:major facilitator superfamily domain-containing protein 8-like [Xenopus laevis]|uniref:Major facilitator superfamily domain-containing protein 8-like n=2 Tax=Xenopus laevis TaxID=8355 RepID=A0A1L8G9S7_XENLA|nr:major facilitator superfamily domain-containing protein 8-like [Xenopus laevis]OCT80600.1 hypothetical protein XELAEV_18027415mg [Xenopus laevis]